jgi:hypothetical protein
MKNTFVAKMGTLKEDDKEADTIPMSQFIELLCRTRFRSISKERNWLRKQAFIEAF